MVDTEFLHALRRITITVSSTAAAPATHAQTSPTSH
jgi:hypothetical protein